MQRRTLALSVCLGIAVVLGSVPALAQYQLKNLVSNQVGAATHTDPLIVNAWGLVHAPGSPIWVADNGSGWSTLYKGSGKAVNLRVLIPSVVNGPGSPTGIVFNGSPDFQFQGWSALFMFATLDGTISAWAPQVDLNQAFIQVNNSASGAVYTGLAISSKASANRLFAADVANNKVDIFDAEFKLVSSFTDAGLPAGFTPFGIQDINGIVYVAFADAAGGRGGFVDTFDENGTLLKRLVQGGKLNQPWGIAIAPASFGPLSNALLVSNNTNSGTINAFNPAT
ncbi:MAG TPA: TIGR03118 family protein, partial [Terriglobales bacterium]|nr:TIGR03118 family protein [Terriglobales bacterium]